MEPTNERIKYIIELFKTKMEIKINQFCYFAMIYEQTLQNDVLFEFNLLNEIKEYFFDFSCDSGL